MMESGIKLELVSCPANTAQSDEIISEVLLCYSRGSTVRKMIAFQPHTPSSRQSVGVVELLERRANRMITPSLVAAACQSEHAELE